MACEVGRLAAVRGEAVDEWGFLLFRNMRLAFIAHRSSFSCFESEDRPQSIEFRGTYGTCRQGWEIRWKTLSVCAHGQCQGQRADGGRLHDEESSEHLGSFAAEGAFERVWVVNECAKLQ